MQLSRPSLSDCDLYDQEWLRFLSYMEREVRPKCKPQRETLAGGPFAWLQTLSGTSFGNKVGPLIVRFFLQEEYGPRLNAGHDFTFRGRKVELKTGTEHSRPGTFLFEQIRPQQDWDAVLCVGLCVRSLVFYVLTRRFVEDAIETWEKVGRSVISPQHGGARSRRPARARPDTFWMWTYPEWDQVLSERRSIFDPNGWHGARLSDALSTMT